MTGFAFDPELDVPLNPLQEDKLTELLRGFGLSSSQAESFVRRMNEPSALSSREEN